MSVEEKYPEHQKLQNVADKSQAIGGFLEWLTSTKGIRTAKYVKVCHDEIIQSEEDVPEEDRSDIYEELVPEHLDINKILAEYYEIDLNKLELEKRAMLDEIRAHNSQ